MNFTAIKAKGINRVEYACSLKIAEDGIAARFSMPLSEKKYAAIGFFDGGIGLRLSDEKNGYKLSECNSRKLFNTKLSGNELDYFPENIRNASAYRFVAKGTKDDDGDILFFFKDFCMRDKK